MTPCHKTTRIEHPYAPKSRPLQTSITTPTTALPLHDPDLVDDLVTLPVPSVRHVLPVPDLCVWSSLIVSLTYVTRNMNDVRPLHDYTVDGGVDGPVHRVSYM